MSVKFKSKPMPVSYKARLSYKLFQLLMIIKIWGPIKLNEIYFLIYILDNEISPEIIEQKSPILFSNYFSNKIIDFTLKSKLIYFYRKKFILSDVGKEFLEKSIELKIFKELIEKVQILKKNKKLIKVCLKNREKLNVKN